MTASTPPWNSRPAQTQNQTQTQNQKLWEVRFSHWGFYEPSRSEVSNLRWRPLITKHHYLNNPPHRLNYCLNYSPLLHPHPPSWNGSQLFLCWSLTWRPLFYKPIFTFSSNSKPVRNQLCFLTELSGIKELIPQSHF